MVAVENYPDLKASDHFMHLQRTLNEVEEQISASRRAFNAAVVDLNNGVETFPSNIVAEMFGFRRRSMFEITDADRQVPNVVRTDTA
jgi:LemA protein